VPIILIDLKVDHYFNFTRQLGWLRSADVSRMRIPFTIIFTRFED